MYMDRNSFINVCVGFHRHNRPDLWGHDLCVALVQGPKTLTCWTSLWHISTMDPKPFFLSLFSDSCLQASSLVAKLQAFYLNVFVPISVDFYHASLSALSTIQQFLIYQRKPNVGFVLWISKARPSFEKIFHDLVFLCLENKPRTYDIP